MNNPYIPPESENKKIARRLIDMGVFDCSEEDELKGTQIYFLQDWLINALDERIDYLSKRLQKEKETGRYQKACYKWFKRWREAKKDALYFDSGLQKQIEATLQLQKDYQELEKKNHAMLVNSLKICNQSEIDNDENERKIAELEAEKDKAWWEGFDTCKAKAGEANVKLSDEITLLKAQIEKMKSDVMRNVKWADQNKNGQMYCKLNAMFNQWRIKEK